MVNGRNDEILIKLNSLAQILYGVKFLRFLFFFYSFLSFVFWFLNCFEVDWLYLFNWLFVIPYQIVSFFYTPHGVSVDFSLAIIGVISLLLGFAFDFVIDAMYHKILAMKEAEQKKLFQRKMKQKERRNAKKATINPNLVQEENSNIVSFGETIENSKLLFLITSEISKIKKSDSELELTFQELELWKQRVNKKLIENFQYSKPMQKGYYRKNLFLTYQDFNYVDDFLYYLKPTLESINTEFKKYRILVSFSYVLSALNSIQNLEKELDLMDTILSINFINEFIVTNRFKINYDNKPVQKYDTKLKGEYNLSKNLTISNRQPLFVLVNKKENNAQ